MTLLELLVVIVIIGLLLALLIPGIQFAREAGRYSQCRSNLRQLGLAIANYESVHGMLPPGTSRGKSLFVNLLPYLEQNELWEQVDYNDPWHGADHLSAVVVHTYLCPSDPAPKLIGTASGRTLAGTNYAGCSGTWVTDNPNFEFNGMFRSLEDCSPYVCGPVTSSKVTDGLSQTAALAEIIRSDGAGARLRAVWEMPHSYGPGEQEAFADACRALPPDPQLNGWRGDKLGRGVPWHAGADYSETYFNSVLTPNQPSCLNKNGVPDAASTASSFHPSGVAVLFGDGRVDCVGPTIDIQLWRSMAGCNDSR
jgi:hypothetical protein